MRKRPIKGRANLIPRDKLRLRMSRMEELGFTKTFPQIRRKSDITRIIREGDNYEVTYADKTTVSFELINFFGTYQLIKKKK